MKTGLLFLLIAFSLTYAQVMIDDFVINNANQNLKGIGRPQIAAHSDQRFAVAWEDFNDYNQPVPDIPRIAVQMYSSAAQRIGAINFFNGESRPLSNWTSDWLEDTDIEFLPDGSLLVAVEHRGDLALGGDFLISSENGLGLISASGQIVDVSGDNGNIYWLIYTTTKRQDSPRLAVAPAGDFYLTAVGLSYNTARHATFVQAFTTAGDLAGDEFYPHPGQNDPQVNHTMPDIATDGKQLAIVWQNGSNDNNWDIALQFYNNQGAVGGNIKVNQGDPAGTINIYPAIHMNKNGQSVVVWADTRTSMRGDVFAQRFNASGQPVGNNIQVSQSLGEVYYRPEVAVRDDGTFMVVWTDSSGVVGNFRARGRQFSWDGQALTHPLVIPNTDIRSGLPDVATDGVHFYLTWLDDRLGQVNVWAKKTGLVTSVVDQQDPVSVAATFELLNAYPNPFNPATTIPFRIDRRQEVRLEIINLQGITVKTLVHETLNPGYYETRWNGLDENNIPVASGIYFYRLFTGNKVHTKKLSLLR